MQDDRLEQLLRAERQVRPDPGAEDRIWAAVEHRLTHGPPPPPGAEVASGAAGGATGTALKLAAGLVLIAGAVGVLVAGERSGSGPPPGREVPAVAVVDVPLNRSEEPGPLPGPALVPAPEVAPTPVESAVEEPAPVEVGKRRTRSRPKSEPADEAPPPGEPGAEDFAAELQLIAEIRGALKRGDSAAALAGVDAHVRRFGARGQLVQERMAYQVEALCAAGRVDAARRVAGDLLARWPDSTHAPRVKQSCAGA